MLSLEIWDDQATDAKVKNKDFLVEHSFTSAVFLIEILYGGNHTGVR